MISPSLTYERTALNASELEKKQATANRRRTNAEESLFARLYRGKTNNEDRGSPHDVNLRQRGYESSEGIIPVPQR